MGTENDNKPMDAKAPVIDENTVEVPPSKKKRAGATDNANWIRESNAEQGIPQENAHLKGKRDYRDDNDAAKRALEEQKENMKLRGITKKEAQEGVPRDVGKNDFKVPKGEIAGNEAEVAAVRQRFEKATAKKPSPEIRLEEGFLGSEPDLEGRRARRQNEQDEKNALDAYNAGRIPDGVIAPRDETESEKRKKADALRVQKEEADKKQKEEENKKKVPIATKTPIITKTSDTKPQTTKTAADVAKELDLESEKMRTGKTTALTDDERAEIKVHTDAVEKTKKMIEGRVDLSDEDRGELVVERDKWKKTREDLRKKYASKAGDREFQSLITKIDEVEQLANNKLNGRSSPIKRPSSIKTTVDAKGQTLDENYGKTIRTLEPKNGRIILERHDGKGGVYYTFNDELVDKDGNVLIERPSAKTKRLALEEHSLSEREKEGTKDSKIKDLVNKIPDINVGLDKKPPKYGAPLGKNTVNGADIFIHADGNGGRYYTNGANDRVDINGVLIAESVEEKEKRIVAQTVTEKEAEESKKRKDTAVKEGLGVVKDLIGAAKTQAGNMVKAADAGVMTKQKGNMLGHGGSGSSGNTSHLSDEKRKEYEEGLRKYQKRLDYVIKNGDRSNPEYPDDTKEYLIGRIAKWKANYKVGSSSSGSDYTTDSHGRVVRKDSLYGSSSGSGHSKGGPAVATKDFSALTTKYSAKDAGGTIMGHARGKDIGGTIMGHAGGKDAAGTIMGRAGNDAGGTIMGRAGHDARGTIMGTNGHDARGTIIGANGHDARGTIMGVAGANAGGSIIDGNGTVIQGVNSVKNAEGSILGKNGRNPEGTIMGANAKNAEGSIIGGMTKKNAANSIMGVLKNNLVTNMAEEPMLDEYGEPIIEYNEDGTPKTPVFAENKTMVVAAKQGNVLGIVPNGKAGHTSRIVRPGMKHTGSMVGGQKEGNAIGVDAHGKAGHPSGIMRGTLQAKEDGSVAVAGARPSKMTHVAAAIGNQRNSVGIHGGHPSGIMRGYAKKDVEGIDSGHTSEIMHGYAKNDASGIDAGHPSDIMRGTVKKEGSSVATGENGGHPSGIMRGTVKKEGNAVATGENGGHPSGIMRGTIKKEGSAVATGENGGHPSKIMRGTVESKKSTTMMDYAAKVGNHPSKMMRGVQTDKMGLVQGDKIGLAQGSKLGFAQTDKIDFAQSEKAGHPSGILRTGAPSKKDGNPVATGEKGGHPSNILRSQIKEKNGHPSKILAKATRFDKAGHPSQMMRQGFSQPVVLTASLAEPSSFENKAVPTALIANNAPMLSQPKMQKDITIPLVKTGPILPPKSNGSMIGGINKPNGFNIPEARHTSIPVPPPSMIAPPVSNNMIVTPSPNTDPRTGMIPEVIKGEKVRLGLSFGATGDVKKESLLSGKML